ncbi:MAG: hypothetical protein J0M15_08800 [Deltaproteobacteria bacterium]|jgi:hypothetical protein|nr:hypothetical protein [Deltaproteobacteria bacterium]
MFKFGFLLIGLSFFSFELFGVQCINFYGNGYSLKQFKQDLMTLELKSGSTYFSGEEKNEAIKTVLTNNLDKMTSEDFTEIALRIIWRETNYLVYVSYSAGAPLYISRGDVLDAFSMIQKFSKNFNLTEKQAYKIRSAMIRRPGSFVEQILTGINAGWSKTDDPKKVLMFDQLSFGKNDIVHPSDKGYTLGMFVSKINFMVSKFLKDDKRIIEFTRHDINIVMGEMLSRYAVHLSPGEFTRVSIWLINTHLDYKEYYWDFSSGPDRRSLGEAYKEIIKASHKVDLNKEQKDLIKSEMQKGLRLYKDETLLDFGIQI